MFRARGTRLIDGAPSVSCQPDAGGIPTPIGRLTSNSKLILFGGDRALNQGYTGQ